MLNVFFWIFFLSAIVIFSIMVCYFIFPNKSFVIKIKGWLFNNEEDLEILAVLFGVFAMLAALFSNMSSSKEQINAIINSTDKQMNKMQQQIDTIRNSTEKQINTIKEFDKNRKEALFSALIEEIKQNIESLEKIQEKKDEYLDQFKNLDIKFIKAPLRQLSLEAYQSNLNNATIDDPYITKVIVNIYAHIKLCQKFIDSLQFSSSSLNVKKENLEEFIEIIDNNLPLFKEKLEELKDYKETQYPKNELKTKEKKDK